MTNSYLHRLKIIFLKTLILIMKSLVPIFPLVIFIYAYVLFQPVVVSRLDSNMIIIIFFLIGGAVSFVVLSILLGISTLVGQLTKRLNAKINNETYRQPIEEIEFTRSYQLDGIYDYLNQLPFPILSKSRSATGCSFYFKELRVFFNIRAHDLVKSNHLTISLPIKFPPFVLNSLEFLLETVDLWVHDPNIIRIPYTEKMYVERIHGDSLIEALNNNNLATYLQNIDPFFDSQSTMISDSELEIRIVNTEKSLTSLLDILTITLDFYQSHKNHRQSSQNYRKSFFSRQRRVGQRHCVICYLPIYDNYINMACCKSSIHISHYIMIKKRCPYCKSSSYEFVNNSNSTN